MVFISSGVFALFLAVPAALFAAGGIAGYILLLSKGLKTEAELFFFCAVSASSFLLIMWISLFSRSRQKTRRLLKKIENARLHGSVLAENLSEAGELGKSIQVLFSEISDISSRRSRRIKFLNEAIEIIFGIVDVPLLLTDISGDVVRASEKYAQLFPENGLHAAGSAIEKLHPEIDFREVSSAAVSMSGTQIDVEKYSAVFFPVYGEDRAADGMIVLFEKKDIFTNAAASIKKTYEDMRSKSEKKANDTAAAKKIRKGADESALTASSKKSSIRDGEASNTASSKKSFPFFS